MIISVDPSSERMGLVAISIERPYRVIAAAVFGPHDARSMEGLRTLIEEAAAWIRDIVVFNPETPLARIVVEQLTQNQRLASLMAAVMAIDAVMTRDGGRTGTGTVHAGSVDRHFNLVQPPTLRGMARYRANKRASIAAVCAMGYDLAMLHCDGTWETADCPEALLQGIAFLDWYQTILTG